MLPEGERLNLIVSIILGEPFDWCVLVDAESRQGTLQLAQYHGVEALIIDRLEADSGWQELPVDSRDELKSRLKIAAAVQLARSQDLISVAKAVEKEGARLLVLKGGGLASSHYSQPYLRDRCDTDIFIDLKHIGLVRQLFLKLGYQEHGSVYKSHQFGFSSTRFGDLSIHYDVHWRINNSARFSRILSFEEANKAAISIEGLPGVSGIKSVHALLLSCVHRAGNPDHDADRLIWIYDIHLLSMGFSDAEWSEFCDMAVSRSVQEVCRQALQKSAAVFKTTVPAAVMEELLVSPPRESFAHRFRMSQLGLIWDDFREMQGLSCRIAMAGEYLFPSGEYLLDRYDKHGRAWVPILYGRYLVGGLLARFSLR